MAPETPSSPAANADEGLEFAASRYVHPVDADSFKAWVRKRDDAVRSAAWAEGYGDGKQDLWDRMRPDLDAAMAAQVQTEAEQATGGGV